MSRPKVHLIGQDKAGWAIDEEFRLTRQALEPFVEFTELAGCDVVHAIWWDRLADISPAKLAGKKVICQLENPPFFWIRQPNFRTAFKTVGMWVAQSKESCDQLAQLGVRHAYCPYKIDTQVFRPLGHSAEGRIGARRELGIPDGVYLIGNFNRDTEGRDLQSPKAQKGPDLFAEIVRGLAAQGLPVHVLLAGPRRFWIRRKLQEYGIPFSFIGKESAGDDYPQNILPRARLNELYNILDLYLITSRWEGGPHAIMEAAAAQCKVVSTRVGLANDILSPECIFDDVPGGVTLLALDIAGGSLGPSVEAQYQRVTGSHQVRIVTGAFRELYAALESVPLFLLEQKPDATVVRPGPNLLEKALKKFNIVSARSLGGGLTLGLWHKFFRPPYGGGNQFMMALKKELMNQKVRVVENTLAENIDVYICNATWFDKDKFIAHSRRHKIRMIQRIDGPTSVYRGSDRTLDNEVFELNARFASATVIQGVWALKKLTELGYHPVDPVVIGNAPDPELFHRQGRREFSSGRKVRLISTSWSDNPRKGGPIYKWIEDHLDWDRFDYTFVGRASEKFSRIRQIPPVPSRELGNILRDHDIYIMASENETCSNALIEAQCCGLPSLYLDSGGNGEIVGYGGLPFLKKEETLAGLDRLVKDYSMFQNVISVPSIASITEKYVAVARAVAGK
ncbi:MAG: glycosyltransferase [Candidatus Omnitrophota bacterium]